MGETVLRVGNIRSEDDLELVRNLLDEMGADYEHVDSDPEDSFPQTAYFQIPLTSPMTPSISSRASPRTTASSPSS